MLMPSMRIPALCDKDPPAQVIAWTSPCYSQARGHAGSRGHPAGGGRRPGPLVVRTFQGEQSSSTQKPPRISLQRMQPAASQTWLAAAELRMTCMLSSRPDQCDDAGGAPGACAEMACCRQAEYPLPYWPGVVLFHSIYAMFEVKRFENFQKYGEVRVGVSLCHDQS